MSRSLAGVSAVSRKEGIEDRVARLEKRLDQLVVAGLPAGADTPSMRVLLRELGTTWQHFNEQYVLAISSKPEDGEAVLYLCLWCGGRALVRDVETRAMVHATDCHRVGV
jgi:hypothetical protein